MWTLFKEHAGNSKKPNHLLCHGLERSITASVNGLETCQVFLPGIIERRINPSLEALKMPMWQNIMALLGHDAGTILSSLLLDYSIFLKVENSKGNYSQLSGVPIYDVLTDERSLKGLFQADQNLKDYTKNTFRPPGSITLVRSRILYGKASFNREGTVHFGLRSSHILIRLANIDSVKQDEILVKYVFPKQFRLHNVFTSTIDRKETVQSFKDYTYREDDPEWVDHRKAGRLPRRLRGGPFELVQKLRRRHSRSSYHQLLSHYCPIPTLASSQPSPTKTDQERRFHKTRCDEDPFSTQLKLSSPSASSLIISSNTSPEDSASFLPYALLPSQVASFCQATILRLLPRDTFGTDLGGNQNWKIVLDNIDIFVRMRRFESINLHQLVQRLKLKSISWLAPANLKANANLAATDKAKREELLYELVYFVFDSLLIPLINSNFYVTESGIHRNKLLYFRHDIWDRLCSPCLHSAKLGNFVALNGSNINNASLTHKLGYSLLRLLPKDVGTRSIINLRRRSMKIANGKHSLGQSINAQLTPIFSILNYERQKDTGVFKSSSFSTQDLHSKLSSFKAQLPKADRQPLYFVKVDIRSAFDSIPQARLLDLVKQIFKHEQYCITSHVEGKVLGQRGNSKPSFKFTKRAAPFGQLLRLDDPHDNTMAHHKNIIHTNIDRCRLISAREAKELLEEHVQSNIVKIGNRYYQQSSGIAQGSILSSLLCTFFYNDFEQNKLSFLRKDCSLLLRIIDDFLLVTTEREQAVKFVRAMKEGDVDFGIAVHPEKSLANFDMTIDGAQIPRVLQTTAFPFCGLLIDTKTLQVSKDRIRKDNVVANTLTVDLHGRAGEKFRRRLESSMRIQLQGIFLDTKLNDRIQILRTLIECFQETAMKMHQYYTNMPKSKKPPQKMLIDVTEQLIDLVVSTVQQHEKGPHMVVTQLQISGVAAAAILRVLTPKRSQYLPFLGWLRELGQRSGYSLNLRNRSLEVLVDSCFKSLVHYKY